MAKKSVSAKKTVAAKAPPFQPPPETHVMVMVATSSPEEAAQQLECKTHDELESQVALLSRKCTALEVTVDELRSKIEKIMDSTSTGVRGECKESDPAIADVLSITHELFPGKVSVELTCDPSDTNFEMVIFNVHGTGPFQALINKEIDWGNRIADLPANSSGKLRLNVVPVK